jgi:hypothetical protein
VGRGSWRGRLNGWLALAAVGAIRTGEENGLGIVFQFVDADLLAFEGDTEAEIVTAREKPIADGMIDPMAHAATDLADTNGSYLEQAGDFSLFEATNDNESVDIEVAVGRDFGMAGHREPPNVHGGAPHDWVAGL